MIAALFHLCQMKKVSFRSNPRFPTDPTDIEQQRAIKIIALFNAEDGVVNLGFEPTSLDGWDCEDARNVYPGNGPGMEARERTFRFVSHHRTAGSRGRDGAWPSSNRVFGKPCYHLSFRAFGSRNS